MLPVTQPTVSKHWRKLLISREIALATAHLREQKTTANPS